MKKLLLSAFVIITFVAYTFQQRHETSKPVLVPTSTSANQNHTSSNAGSQTSPTATQSSNSYKDGTYTGDVADAFYGYIQVQATVQGGKITDVQFLQYPNDRQNSVFINSQAMPILKDEAIKAQNSRVDIVSGATDTSMAFIQSLSSALSKAS